MSQHDVVNLWRVRAAPVVAKVAATGAVVAVSVFAGATATGVAQARLGAKPALMLMGAMAAGGLLAVFARARHQVLFVWPVLTGALFPFVQVPKVNPVVTFDRIWIGSMVAAIAGAGFSARRPRARVAFDRALVVLAVVWGVMSAFAP